MRVDQMSALASPNSIAPDEELELLEDELEDEELDGALLSSPPQPDSVKRARAANTERNHPDRPTRRKKMIISDGGDSWRLQRAEMMA
jgi:hypothetical protein